jgi:hypothetical protein
MRLRHGTRISISPERGRLHSVDPICAGRETCAFTCLSLHLLWPALASFVSPSTVDLALREASSREIVTTWSDTRTFTLATEHHPLLTQHPITPHTTYITTATTTSPTMASQNTNPTSQPESFSKMSTGDVEAIGAHCQMPFCRQLDLLPFRCESCKG